ncbi:MAG TPA: rhomboid family intramembrane serine protease [Polyangiaceae bacterium]|nr:rhomboid family intramembrane serine protease [Polyangiaceae bacterium]
MLVVPLSHERNLARRWPWVTTVIVLLNVAALFLCTMNDQRVAIELEQRVQEAAEYYAQHPWLELQPPLTTWLPDLARSAPARAPEPGSPIAEQQAELDRQTQELEQARHGLSSWRFGYNHARGEWPGLLTHQFLHRGVLHLLFNMWFLWLVGCNVEDAWGRLLFTGFYLSGGAIAGLVHAWMTGSSQLILIGASGAVAAAMGAFLVGFASTRIRFFGLLLIRPMTFSAPAYVMLPLWASGELVSGVADSGGGVAHWAHVGGFVYGFLVALGLRLSGVEKRIDEVLDQSEGYAVDPAITRASALIDAGKPAAALALLREHATAPEQSGALALSELLRAQRALGDHEGALATQLRLLEGYLQQQAVEQALGVFEELCAEGARGRVPPHLVLRLARQYRRRGDAERAASAFEEVHSASQRSEHALPALLGHAELALELGRADAARQLYERARSFVSRDVQVESAIRQGLARASQLRRPSTQPPPPA